MKSVGKLYPIDGTLTYFEHTIQSLIRVARKSVVYYDPLFCDEYLYLFDDKLPWVKVQIVTIPTANISQEEIKKFNEEYGGLEILFKDEFSNRALLIDGTYLFLIDVDGEKNIGFLSPIRDDWFIKPFVDRIKSLKREL